MRYFLAIQCLFILANAFALNDSLKVSFDAEIRYRFEAWEGMNAKNYGDDSPTAIGSLHDKHHLGNEFNIFTRYKLNKNWHFTGVLGNFTPNDVQPVNYKKPGNAGMLLSRSNIH